MKGQKIEQFSKKRKEKKTFWAKKKQAGTELEKKKKEFLGTKNWEKFE